MLESHLGDVAQPGRVPSAGGYVLTARGLGCCLQEESTSRKAEGQCQPGGQPHARSRLGLCWREVAAVSGLPWARCRTPSVLLAAWRPARRGDAVLTLRGSSFPGKVLASQEAPPLATSWLAAHVHRVLGVLHRGTGGGVGRQGRGACPLPVLGLQADFLAWENFN